MRTNALLIAAALLVAACGGETTATETPRSAASRIAATYEPAIAAENADVAALRTATARFHRIEDATVPGEYDTQFPAGCFSSPEGGMGFHWIKSSNVGKLSPTEPQLLLYEPEADGSMRLVGVEFIFPGEPTDTPPVLFGQPFVYSTRFGVWALHVWAWKDNPSGLYADWNPTVSCEHAAVLATGAHH